MTREEIKTELADLLELAKSHEAAVDSLKQCMEDEQEKMRSAVSSYEAKHRELFNAEMSAKGLTWCTCCRGTFPESGVHLLLLEGTKEVSSGYEGSCYGYENFSKLHRVCSACREEVVNQHGKHGRFNRVANGQTKFYAFSVEKREDGNYVRKFGDWHKLDGEQCKLPEIPLGLFELLVSLWEFPPRVELCYKHGGPRVAVYEPVQKMEMVNSGQTASVEA